VAFETGRLGAVAGAAALAYGLSLLAPGGPAGVAVKIVLLAAFVLAAAATISRTRHARQAL
jgi:hypothetical protein